MSERTRNLDYRGELTARSEPGVGSTFTLTLPRNADDQTVKADASAREQSSAA